MKQKIIYAIGLHDLARQLDELFDAGWVLVPTSLVHSPKNDSCVAVVEIPDEQKAEIPSTQG